MKERIKRMKETVQTQMSRSVNIPFVGSVFVGDVLWAVLPGIIACFAILHHFFLSNGEFIYLDWNGASVDFRPITQFMQVSGQDGLGFRRIPFLLTQMPFVLLFGAGASAIFSKLFFLFMFLIGSLGLFLLLKEYSRSVYLLSCAILFFSPFLYERIMMGQFGVVFSLTALPLILYLVKRFLDKPLVSTAWQPAFALTFLSIQLHGLIINACMVLVYLFVHLSMSKKPIALAKPYLQFFAILIVFNLYWLAPYVLLPNPQIFSSIDASHLEFFKSNPSANFNTLAKSAGMYGAWRESAMKLAYNNPLFSIPKDIWKYSSLFFAAVLIFLSIYAILHYPKNELFITLVIGWVVGLLLATGISHPWTSGIFDWLFEHVPLFSGFRDSNKWVELVVMTYSVLAAIGASLVFGKKNSAYVIGAIMLGVLLYNYVAFGLSEQLMPGSVPPEYMSMQELVSSSGQTIYLPWVIYATYNWSLEFGLDGRITTPMKFGQPDIKFGASTPDMGSITVQEREIELCLESQDANCLVENNISRIIFDECFLEKGMYSWFSANHTVYKKHGCLSVYEID